MNNDFKPGVSRRKFVGVTAKAAAAFFIIPRHVLGGVGRNGIAYTAPSDVINLGVIGCGKQSRGLSRSFLSTGQARIAGISEVYQAKAQLTLDAIKDYYTKTPSAGTMPDIPVYNDFRELLARKDVDAVLIVTPDHWHAAMAVRAAEAGKDIYCEKPLSLTVKEGRAMVNAARKHNRVFQTGNMQRSWPEFRQAVELVRNGYIGQIKSAKVNVGAPPVPYTLAAQPMPEGLDWTKWLGPNDAVVFNEELAPPTSKDVFPNWRLYKEFGGGMVTDFGAHMFDIVQWALDMDNSGPIELIPPNGSDIKNLTFNYANGVVMTHEKFDWMNAIHFIGTEGEIKIGRKKLETTPAALAERKIGDNEKRVYFSDNHYKDFLNAMRTRKKPISDVEVGHRTASVCNIANIAYQVNQPLQWDPKKEVFKNNQQANALLGRKMNKEWGIKI